MTIRIATLLVVAAIGVTPAMVTSQAPQPPQGGPPGPGGQAGRGGRGGPPAYPPREVDAAMVARGGEFYKAQCAFCHGADTRGASGPSLLRSQLVQDDRNGETIGLVLRAGRPPAMPRFDMSDAQLADIAAFLHSFQINSRDPARMRPIDILTGDAAAGQAYFTAKCGSCHAVDRDLKGLASRIPEPRALQQWWLMPGGGGGRGGGPPVEGAETPVGRITATVTLASGQKFEGRLAKLDEFTVSVVEADGTTRTFTRRGDVPRVEIRDPLAAHKAMLREYTDKNIHDVTAFLVTLK